MSVNEAIRPVDLLRIKPFRLLWLNSFVFILVQSTQRFAFVWLALGLGAKSDISGFILFVMGVPALLISLPVGVMSDHMNRRAILMVSQIGALGITIGIAAMITFDQMTINPYVQPSSQLWLRATNWLAPLPSALLETTSA